MTTAINVVIGLTLAALAVATVVGTARAIAPRAALPDPWTLDVDWAVRAIDTLVTCHPTQRRGGIVVSGVPVEVVHVVRVDGESAWPMWLVRVGEHSGEVPTYEGALDLVRVRLEAIAAGRAERAAERVRT